MQPLVDQVVDLDEDRRGHDEGLSSRFEEAPARPVVGVAAIQRSVQRPVSRTNATDGLRGAPPRSDARCQYDPSRPSPGFAVAGDGR